MQDKSNIYPELKILSPLEQTWASYSRNPLAMAGLWCFLLLLLITLVGPLVVPYGIDEQHTDKLLLAPSWAATGNIDYFLGTDDLGRDMLSRLVVGARLTFGYALVVVVIAMVVGSAIGILGGMSKGLKSSVLHHLLDTLLSIPSLLMAIIMVAIMGPGFGNTLIAITLALIPPFIRATYNAVHAEMQKEYITASRLDGSPPFRIMRLAILPNIVETLVAQTTRTLSAAILDISAVGFLGLGAQ
ncbi:MAG: ABC transporter permease subunit, partial [Aeromonas veronii]